MVTSIQVSEKLLKKLKARKMHDNESYENIIWDLLEDTKELSEQTRNNIVQSVKEIKSGKTIPLSRVKKEAGI
jgi:hypothetical protein